MTPNKTLLLISKFPEDIAFARTVAQVNNLEFKHEADPATAIRMVGDGFGDIIFADGSTEAVYQSIELAIQEKIGLFSDRINANMIHWISGEDLQKVTYLFESPVFGHYISRTYGNPVEAGNRYGMLVQSTLAERAFGLKNVMSKGTRTQEVKFGNTKQKQEAVEAVKNFLLAAKFKTRMATVIANAVDELVMNAMFDAPVDALGKQIYVSTPRDKEMQLTGKSEVEMHVGYDSTYVAITAIDHFGSLDKLRLFSHISKRYVEEEYKVKTSVAGAGIGLATVFRTGGSFLFSSEKGVRTEVTVFFRRTDNFREFKDQFRFISTQFYF